ncbi:MAG: SGNH/GDSL hydrolase family protein [Candidatus Pacearchaeota archaeon]
MKKILKQKISLIFLGLIIGFLIIEFFLRLFWQGSLYTIDKKTGLVILKPLKKLIFKKSCFKNVIKTNSWGFHTSEFNLEKESNEYRILVVGDSYAEAAQVPLEKSFHKLLEKALNEKNTSKKKVVVYSIGISGNGTYLNYLYFLNYGKLLKPDLVILLFCSNDPRDDSLELGKIYAKQTGDFMVLKRKYPNFDEKGNLILKENAESKFFFLKEFFKNFRSLVFLYRKYTELKNHLFMEKSISKNEILVDNYIFLKEWPKEINKAWEDEKKILKEFKLSIESIGAKFLIVSVTDHWRVDEEIAKSYPWFEKIDLKKMEKTLENITSELGINYLSLIEQFQERFKTTREKEVFDCDGHWNEIGHKWASEIISDYLLFNQNLLK